MIFTPPRYTRGAVIVKVGRLRQDPRYDLPAVGPQTVGALAAALAHVDILPRVRATAEALAARWVKDGR